jgi:hypothetical protein
MPLPALPERHLGPPRCPASAGQGRGTDAQARGNRRTHRRDWLRANVWHLAIRGIEADLGPRWGDSFHDDLHTDLKADYVMANSPFNVSDWGGELLRDDPRCKYGVPPAGKRQLRLGTAHGQPPLAAGRCRHRAGERGRIA